ncbi:MAG: glycosyltransferase [Acidimicrobiales bacterium]
MNAVSAELGVVRVVVLNFNGDPHLFRCLDALAATDWPSDRLQVVVVDNNSADGSAEVVAARYPNVELRRLGTNTGFPANNAALRDLGGVDFVALINNDAFVTPGWLKPLVDTLVAEPDLAAACPKLLFAPRFVELAIRSSTFSVPNDSRQLGVRISGVEVDGVDCWRPAQFPPPGFWGIERGRAPEERFCWTNGDARLRVPTESAPAQPAAEGSVSAAVRVRLATNQTTVVTIGEGEHQRRIEVGPQPGWFDVTVEGHPFDVVQNAGSMVLEGGYGADRGFLEIDEGQWDQPEEVFAWCGGGVLFRPAYLADVGLFDERFFAYYEDTDLAWRGRARGWRYRYVPASVLRHQHATTSVEGSALFQRYVERNRLAMLTKNAAPPMVLGALFHYVLTTLSYARRDLWGPLRRRRRPVVGVVALRLRSLGSYGQMLPHLLTQRRRQRRQATVSDAALAAWFQRR